MRSASALRRIASLLAASSLLLASLATAAQSGAAGTPGIETPVPAGKTLVIGRVSDRPAKHYRYMKPLVDYVARHLEDLGYTGGDVVIAKSDEQMVDMFRRGTVDWMSETAFSAHAYREKAGAEYLVRRWKKGVAEYHTVIFVRDDSGIESLADLRGRKIAFEDEGSTSAFFIPAGELLAHGYELVPLGSPRDEAPPDTVGYAFARQEVNTTGWVHRRLVDAGAYSNLDWDAGKHFDDEARAELRVIHRTRSFPRAVELVRATLDPEVKQRIKEVLLAAEHDLGGRAALATYQRTLRFDAISEEMQDALEEVGRMRELVAKQLL